MTFLPAFIESCRARVLFPKEKNRVVVACSGGADSLFLLYLLWAVRNELNLELSVVTCDHGLRPESADEAHEVRQRAWTLGLPCKLCELNVPRNQHANESIEMAARRLRRRAYAEIAEEFQADQVALGHHMDDQAETILLKLARGTGPRGAGGMNWISPLNEKVSLVRPLLSTPRKEIESQVEVWGLKPAHDPSNRNREHLRNRMRHDLLPLIAEQINPKVVQHLWEFSEQQRKLEAWVSLEAQERGKGCLDGDTLQLEPWRFLPEILQERILFSWLKRAGADLGCVRGAQLRELLSELNRRVSHSRRWEIGGVSVRVDQSVLSQDLKPQKPKSTSLSWPGNVLWEPLCRPLNISSAAKVDIQASRMNDFSHTLTAFMKKPPPGQKLSLRPPRPGDRYQPLGMKGNAKLSDLFINRHMPAKVRPLWPVVICGNEIVWVPGFRVAEQWRAGKGECLKLELV